MLNLGSTVLVVEGTSDVNFLSSFVQADFVITNGSEVSRETIDYIKALVKNHTVVVLTDPDAPGKRIRARLDEEIDGLQHAYAERSQCIGKYKLGIAESNPEAIVAALSHIVPADSFIGGKLDNEDLYRLGLVGTSASSFRRAKVATHFHLGHPNGKTLLKRLNQLAVSFSELAAYLKEIDECK